MKQDRPHLVTTEENRSYPILIIDRKGIVGGELAARLKEQFLVVLVSGKELEFQDNIVHIPYRKKIPTIPDNSYSHIFVFYNGEVETLEILPILMKKANTSSGKLFFLFSLIYSSEALFRRLANHNYHSMATIVYGEVFEEKIRIPNMVNLFIYQSRKFGRLQIPHEGMGKHYPIYLHDLLIVIIAAAFSQEKKNGNLFVFPKFPFTEVSIARMFQKINSDLKIDFTKRQIQQGNYHIPEAGEYAFKNYNPEEGLKKIQLGQSDKNSLSPEKEVTLPKKKLNIDLRLAVLLLFASLILPLLLTIASGLIGTVFASLAMNQAESGKFLAASRYARVGKASFDTAVSLGSSYFPADIVAPSVKENIVRNLNTGKEATEVEAELFLSLNTLSDIYNKKSRDPKKEFSESLADIKNTLLKLSQMKAEGNLPENIQKKLDEHDYILTLFENTIDTYSHLAGFDTRKRYLMLFQNNMELRPGGGFIGSYALLEMQEGRVEKFEIHDVYDADGRLKTHVEPPFGLKRFGGVTHWFLRDSNFAIDPIINAAAAADIYKRETGEKVNGIISVDTNFIKNLLSALGPVEVQDYKEKVDAENFYMLTQKHAEDNFFPGSTQKKDFLRALLKTIQTRIFDERKVPYLSILKQVEKSLKEKHLFFVFENQAIQKVYTVNNLSGGFWDERKRDENSFLDYFGVVDANIGGNKSNYYLKRSIKQNVTLNESGGVQIISEVVYENTSTAKSAFGGEYKNYVRFVLPGGADLNSVQIDDQEVAITQAVTNPSAYDSPAFTPPQELEVEATQVEGKEVVAFLLKVPVSMTKRVTITYTIPDKVNLASPAFSYNLRVFKQPGTDQDPYALTLSYPSKFIPVNLEKNIVDLGGKLTFEKRLTEDQDIKIDFSQK